MTQVSISEAAHLVGRDRKTLYKDINSGRLSATTSATGRRQVDVAELCRVYGALRHIGDNGDSRATVEIPQKATLNATQATTELKAKLAAAEAELLQVRERLADKERHIEDMRNAMRLLEHKSAEKRPWWRW